MGYIKEPKGVDFVMDPTPLTSEDRKNIDDAIARYKATGRITRAPKPTKRSRKTSPKKKSNSKI